MLTLQLHDSTVRILQRFMPTRSSWDWFLVELLNQQPDREDAECARKVLQDFREGVDVAIHLSDVRRGFLRPRRKKLATM